MSADQNFPSYTSELWLKKKIKTENKVNIIFITSLNVKCSNILDPTNTANYYCKMLLNCRDVEMWKYVHLRTDET